MAKDKKMNEEEFILRQIKRNKVVFNICSVVFVIILIAMVLMVLLVAISKSEVTLSIMAIVVFIVLLLFFPYMRKLKKNCGTAINEMTAAANDGSLCEQHEYSKETKQARKTAARSVKQVISSIVGLAVLIGLLWGASGLMLWLSSFNGGDVALIVIASIFAGVSIPIVVLLILYIIDIAPARKLEALREQNKEEK